MCWKSTVCFLTYKIMQITMLIAGSPIVICDHMFLQLALKRPVCQCGHFSQENKKGQTHKLGSFSSPVFRLVAYAKRAKLLKQY